jgi:ADP-ribosylglycohydrolase
MILSMNDFRNKVEGCWMGKNIGGTLGAPFEGRRRINEIDFYTQNLGGEPVPNDDLDLQLVWLNAAERYGRGVNASILGEYWHSYIVPNWNEYGIGKNNMRAGILPPLSGYVRNVFKDSCGAFIRSEIWACLSPGHPEIAARYAYEDAIVDHSHEGLYGEIFCAAVESAAFVVSDKFKLIDIGLSYIPADCGVRKGVQIAIECYQAGLTWKEARKKLLIGVPGTVGEWAAEPWGEKDIPGGEIGWDTPSNIGIIIIGWLYGEDDFGKSLCIAAGCGEDADCTAATLGSILGIIHGIEGVPVKWIEPLGDKIKTLCLNLGDQGIIIPKTIGELTERILKLTPVFLGSNMCDFINSAKGYTVEMLEGEKLFMTAVNKGAWVTASFEDLLRQSPFMVKNDFVIFNTVLDYGEEPFVQEGKPKKFKLLIENNHFVQQWIKVKWHIPDGWEVLPGMNTTVFLGHYHLHGGTSEMEFTVIPHGLKEDHYDLVIEMSSNGRHTRGFIPVLLMNS